MLSEGGESPQYLLETISTVSILYQNIQDIEARGLRDLARKRGIELVGFTNLTHVEGIPSGHESTAVEIIRRYPWAIVLGVQLGKLGEITAGIDVDIYLERIALEMSADLEERGRRALIIHPEDEFDPVNRKGLLSLKMLAKQAGLGWLGRSLLIVSPEYGPIHRLIAVLTETELPTDDSIPNQCGDCTLCIENCPSGALTLASFHDHPGEREDVLNIDRCLGDLGCKLCLEICPWGKQTCGETVEDKLPFDSKEEML